MDYIAEHSTAHGLYNSYVPIMEFQFKKRSCLIKTIVKARLMK